MDSIDTLADAYALAVYEKDEAAFLSLYDMDVLVFDAWGPWSYEGRDAWAAMVRDWFASLGEERVKVTFTPEKSLVGDDWAVWCATTRYAAIAPSGEELRALENRTSWSLRRRDGRWRIVHEHSSGPADFETLKVTLHRP
ncbi:YybH family protein [Sphingomonas sp. VDB2]|uniref:YybH family protein n=1 Tax=Sphingomonas sp. VDB2 TaxID=3228751 RepID=UPI003A813426